MRKLDLRDYQFRETVHRPIGVEDGAVKMIEEEVVAPYFVKDSILNIMFLPELRLQGAALVKQNVLAMKIEQADGEIMLEEEEYERIKMAAEVYVARSRADVELIDRILNKTPETE